MSKELLILMERIQRFKTPSNEPPKPSVDLAHLWGRMETQRWVESSKEELTGFIEQSQAERRFIKHAPKCDLCMAELQIGIERYLGSRLPWFLNLMGEIGMPDDFEYDNECAPYLKDRPMVKDYEIGCYGHSSDDTIRFIKDRLAWADKKLKNDLGVATKALFILENWKPTCRTVQSVTDKMIHDVNVLTYSISPFFPY